MKHASGAGYEDVLDERESFAALYDIYSSLLTNRQRAACELLFRSDLNAPEIAEELGVTRQGAHDIIKRTRDALYSYETLLRLKEMSDTREKLRELVAVFSDALPADFLSRASELLS